MWGAVRPGEQRSRQCARSVRLVTSSKADRPANRLNRPSSDSLRAGLGLTALAPRQRVAVCCARARIKWPRGIRSPRSQEVAAEFRSVQGNVLLTTTWTAKRGLQLHLRSRLLPIGWPQRATVNANHMDYTSVRLGDATWSPSYRRLATPGYGRSATRGVNLFTLLILLAALLSGCAATPEQTLAPQQSAAAAAAEPTPPPVPPKPEYAEVDGATLYKIIVAELAARAWPDGSVCQELP